MSDHGPRSRRPSWPALVLLALLATARPGAGDPPGTRLGESDWQVGRAVPIAVTEGRTGFEVPTPHPDSQVLVIVSALARGSGPFPIRLTAQPADRIAPPVLADDGPPPGPKPAPAPRVPSPPDPVGWPPADRVFHLMVKDGDVACPSNYLAVPARLRAVGHRVQIYVDVNDLARVGPDVLRDVAKTFDEQIVPKAVGRARDVDGDGRFTVLLTSWLGRLAGGRLTVDGFVRAADLDPEMGPPFGNRCDMMYLNAGLRAGPHLRTVVAHEYTHAVLASLKAFAGPGGIRSGSEEEGWLDEALAHLAEDRHGFSRSNLDYRVSAFLSAPERYRLVVEDYYAADLFRSHGHRGSTYLFLRWCADRYGSNLLKTLARSDQRGVANVETATGAPFAELYRRWSVAVGLGGLDPAGDLQGYRALDLRGRFGTYSLAGPRTSLVDPGGPADDWTAAGTTSHFAIVSAAPDGAVRIEVTGPPAAQLQVTAVPLPERLPRLELSAFRVAQSGGLPRVRLQVRESHGTPVHLTSLSWEPLAPPANPHSAGPHRGELDPAGLASTFGSLDLPGRDQLDGQPLTPIGIRLEDGPLIFKLVATDPQGRRVAAWAPLDLEPFTPEGLASDGPPTP